MDEHAPECRFVMENVCNTACTCGFLEHDIKRNFEQKHAVVHADPLTELKRRRAPWAMCPDSRGNALDAQIVPEKTLEAAIAELQQWRTFARRAKTRGTA